MKKLEIMFEIAQFLFIFGFSMLVSVRLGAFKPESITLVIIFVLYGLLQYAKGRMDEEEAATEFISDLGDVIREKLEQSITSFPVKYERRDNN